jgi:hypothetical protein
MTALKGKITRTDVPADVKPSQGRDSTRDETQQGIDAEVTDLRAKWEAAGKPTYEALSALDEQGNPSAEWKAANKQSYTVSKEDKRAVKDMIRRACTLAKGAPVYAGDVKNADGSFTVVFTYGPKPVPKATASATPNADGGNTDAPPSGAEQDTEAGPGESADTPGADSDTGNRGGLLRGRR